MGWDKDFWKHPDEIRDDETATIISKLSKSTGKQLVAEYRDEKWAITYFLSYQHLDCSDEWFVRKAKECNEKYLKHFNLDE